MVLTSDIRFQVFEVRHEFPCFFRKNADKSLAKTDSPRTVEDLQNRMELQALLYIWFGITASTMYDPGNSPALHLESDHQYSTTFLLVLSLEYDSSSASSDDTAG
eukprot:CAMPEP_0172375280 /NCGR_PEP_ID=MMETSP1060-20121228/60787_1 /TAXON_ID=37318 /ORGANISM="Pseudo-nitzschia pungens, Strain cf. cingulata" /LENGTH=104 /DNA_ID=CAMNT_0013102347 /DNA_START=28 /DNA_END=340 /DNA_ORIENTATION=-